MGQALPSPYPPEQRIPAGSPHPGTGTLQVVWDDLWYFLRTAAISQYDQARLVQYVAGGTG